MTVHVHTVRIDVAQNIIDGLRTSPHTHMFMRSHYVFSDDMQAVMSGQVQN